MAIVTSADGNQITPSFNYQVVFGDLFLDFLRATNLKKQAYCQSPYDPNKLRSSFHEVTPSD
jgi:hypothetical protein